MKNRNGLVHCKIVEALRLITAISSCWRPIQRQRKNNSRACGEPKQIPRHAGRETDEVLRIGASHGFSMSLVPMLMARFRENHPEVNMNLHIKTSGEIVNQLLESKVHIGVVNNPKRVAALHMEPFRSSRFCALVTSNHPLAKRETLNFSELAKIPLVVREGSSGRTELLLKKLRRNCSKPNIAFRCGSPEAVKTAVRHGAGVGILVDDAVQDEFSRKEFKTLNIAGVDLSVKSYILYAKKNALSKTAEAFLKVLRAWRMNNSNRN
jgi:DNA-binding transcriptional LysR family regulator